MPQHHPANGFDQQAHPAETGPPLFQKCAAGNDLAAIFTDQLGIAFQLPQLVQLRRAALVRLNGQRRNLQRLPGQVCLRQLPIRHDGWQKRNFQFLMVVVKIRVLPGPSAKSREPRQVRQQLPGFRLINVPRHPARLHRPELGPPTALPRGLEADLFQAVQILLAQLTFGYKLHLQGIHRHRLFQAQLRFLVFHYGQKPVYAGGIAVNRRPENLPGLTQHTSQPNLMRHRIRQAHHLAVEHVFPRFGGGIFRGRRHQRAQGFLGDGGRRKFFRHRLFFDNVVKTITWTEMWTIQLIFPENATGLVRTIRTKRCRR